MSYTAHNIHEHKWPFALGLVIERDRSLGVACPSHDSRAKAGGLYPVIGDDAFVFKTINERAGRVIGSFGGHVAGLNVHDIVAAFTATVTPGNEKTDALVIVATERAGRHFGDHCSLPAAGIASVSRTRARLADPKGFVVFQAKFFVNFEHAEIRFVGLLDMFPQERVIFAGNNARPTRRGIWRVRV